MPGYWFMYNMYALARNEGKYISRDKRYDKSQHIEYAVFAPDSINEMFDALALMKKFTAKAHSIKNNIPVIEKDLLKKGETLLENNTAALSTLEITAEGFENSNRIVQLIKVPEAYKLFRDFIVYYGVTQLIQLIEQKNIQSWQKLIQSLPGNVNRTAWKNIGGQLIPETALHTFIKNIRSAKINSWDEVHAFYAKKSESYSADKLQHAFASLLEILKLPASRFTKKLFIHLLEQAVVTKESIAKSIYDSRAKDYSNEFRKMVYDTQEEMDKVIGKLNDNSFINQQLNETIAFAAKVTAIINMLK